MPNSMMINRRQLMLGLGAGSVGVLALRGYDAQAQANVHFTHGIASGDPLQDRVIIWTRVIPGNGQHQDINCEWQVAKHPSFQQLVAQGRSSTNKQRDYTVKVDANGLAPGESYYYRFIAEGVTSPIGQTKTLPDHNAEHFTLAVASCSNFPQGYFNAFRHMAEAELDLVLHLGDYIYEYKEGDYANPVALEKLGRHVKPEHEITGLEDYRMRYGLYRSDQDLQAVHARHPFICVWDDHELSNNTWKDGAQNHSPDEGDFHQRMAAARQAYHEWLPIRTSKEGHQTPIFRHFQIGNLADLIMLDTRLHGRDRGYDYRKDVPLTKGVFDISKPEQPTFVQLAKPNSQASVNQEHLLLPFDHSSGKAEMVTDYFKIKSLDPKALPKHWHYLPDFAGFKKHILQDPNRTILGQDQEQWLKQQLIHSKQRNAPWQILGQQVVMGTIGMPAFTPEQIQLPEGTTKVPDFIKFMRDSQPYQLPMNLDAWDGYPAARSRLYQDLLSHANNPLILAGDTHNSWAFNLRDDSHTPVGVEIATPGISSPGMESYLPTSAAVAKAALKKVSPELVDMDASQRGWTEIQLSQKEMSSRWHFVSTVLDKSFTVNQSSILTAKAGERKLRSKT